jgi:hypothetical protein
MPGLFDKPTCKLPISEAEIAQLRARIPSWMIKRFGESAMIDAEFLRRAFREELGGCTVLNGDRFLAIGMRLEEQQTPLQIFQAILAYAAEIKTNAYRLANPSARQSLEEFVASKRFDVYVALGEKLVESRKLAKMETLLRKMTAAEQAALLADAMRWIERNGTRYTGQRTLANPVVRREALRLLLDYQTRQEAGK